MPAYEGYTLSDDSLLGFKEWNPYPDNFPIQAGSKFALPL